MEQNNRQGYIPETDDGVLFENICKDRKAALKELCTYLHFKQTWRVIFFVIIGVILLADIVLFCVLLSTGVGINKKLIFFFLFFLLVLFYVFYVIAGYRSSIKLALQREEETNPNGNAYICRIKQDVILAKISNDDSEQEISLDLFDVAIQTPKYVFLRTKGKLYYILAKDGFTMGRYEDFCTFLCSKHLKMKSK